MPSRQLEHRMKGKLWGSRRTAQGKVICEYHPKYFSSTRIRILPLLLARRSKAFLRFRRGTIKRRSKRNDAEGRDPADVRRVRHMNIRSPLPCYAASKTSKRCWLKMEAEGRDPSRDVLRSCALCAPSYQQRSRSC